MPSLINQHHHQLQTLLILSSSSHSYNICLRLISRLVLTPSSLLRCPPLKPPLPLLRHSPAADSQQGQHRTCNIKTNYSAAAAAACSSLTINDNIDVMEKIDGDKVSSRFYYACSMSNVHFFIYVQCPSMLVRCI